MTARILKKHNLDVAHKPVNKLKTLFNKHKDRPKPLDKTNVIYKIPCQDCEQVYIGETSKTANTHITQHKNAIKREDPRSLPATHIINHDHRFDWTKTTILDHGTTREAREFKEAWHSIQIPSINRHIDIPHAYAHLPHKNGSQRTNRNTEQNQPINAQENQPISNQPTQPIRRSLRLRNKHIQIPPTSDIPT